MSRATEIITAAVRERVGREGLDLLAETRVAERFSSRVDPIITSQLAGSGQFV